ncbi:fungal-specific transcription factor domain-domain-containing protein [Naematelia encephala]|uniref:Fungal-specific transcription factor domain-domain-containing protein n=1 Tax=Naematelia encephala TaxID=71784 RepID=A0A1Y2AI88_9TREE|nr:fungal-specific transcription factor domain-domain-containing protein [Naematelia encephala]
MHPLHYRVRACDTGAWIDILLSFTRREVLRRHESLHSQPQSRRPRVRPVVQSTSISEEAGSLNAGDQSLWTSPASETAIAEGDRPISPTGNPSDDPLIWPTSDQTDVDKTPTAEEIERFDMDISLQEWLDSLFQAPGPDPMNLVTAPSPIASSTIPVKEHGADIHTRSGTEWVGRLEDISDLVNSSPADVIQGHLDRYWNTVDVHYPVVHRPSFSTSTADPLLLATMVVLGGISSPLVADRQASASMLSGLRGHAVQRNASALDQQLAILQTLLLLNVASHSLEENERDQGHAILSFSLTLARRFNLYEEPRKTIPSDHVNLDQRWQEWIHAESLRRVAWAILVDDIAYASFFQQLPSRACSPFRLPVELPCSSAAWDAHCATLWSTQIVPGETLACALRGLIARGGITLRSSLTLDPPFGRLILIHGLMALWWDVNRRDLIAPEMSKAVPSGMDNFLLRAFNTLDVPETANHGSGSMAAMVTDIRTASFIGKLQLVLDLTTLQVFAGVTRIGVLQPVRPSDYIGAGKRLRRWADSPQGASCTTMSLRFLECSIMTVNSASTSKHCWTLYLAFLTVWAYSIIRNKGLLERGDKAAHPGGFEELALIDCRAMCGWLENSEQDPPAHCSILGLGTWLVQKPQQSLIAYLECNDTGSDDQSAST